MGAFLVFSVVPECSVMFRVPVFLEVLHATKFVSVTEAAGLTGHTKLEALSNITWSRSHRKILNVR